MSIIISQCCYHSQVIQFLHKRGLAILYFLIYSNITCPIVNLIEQTVLISEFPQISQSHSYIVSFINMIYEKKCHQVLLVIIISAAVRLHGMLLITCNLNHAIYLYLIFRYS